jgi:hypothetical protein
MQKAGVVDAGLHLRMNDEQRGHWSFVIGHSSLVIGHWSFAKDE